ncbi:MAG: inositol monophosphatase [Phycisphaerae bacterium]|nr:inositol monophosphatase [Phycisphaerae bacterium]
MREGRVLAAEVEVAARLSAAVRIGLEAGALALRHFEAGVMAEEKADGTPVTVADRGAEEMIRAAVGREFSADGMLGEEFGETAGRSGYRWVVDPIDGTKSFVRGVPLWGTLVGIERMRGESEPEPVAGVMVFPGLGEHAYAGLGGGAWHVRRGGEAVRARASGCVELSEAAVCVTSPQGFARRGAWAAYERLVRRSRLARGWSDCYAYLLVALGRIEAAVDPAMRPWDAAAIAPILKEAGAVYVDWHGRETIHGRDGIGAARGVVAEVVEVVRGGEERGAGGA